ncbi:hypothetical protein ACFWDF_02870 [Streptomyces diastaticus]|uniref:DUF7426 family protein n=1 Tax=Streptomyces diastaticus TaxID=1956 RepID=UPI0036B65656
MAFREVDELLDETLQLPIRGRVYTVPAPPAAVGLRTQRLIAIAARAADGDDVDVDAELLADAEERDLYAEVLGGAYEEMMADGVSWPVLKHASVTAMVWIAQNKDAAEKYWNTGGDPKRMAPNRAARRSGGANTTRSQGSTSGTSTRTAPRHRARKRR